MNEKSADWYWALGILATAIAIASVLFGNVLLAIVIIAAATAIALAGSKHPAVHRFLLTDEGLVVDQTLFLYDTIISFSVLEYLDETLPPFLSVKTKGILVPHISVPLENVDPDAVYNFLSSHLTEEAHPPTAADHLIELFRI